MRQGGAPAGASGIPNKSRGKCRNSRHRHSCLCCTARLRRKLSAVSFQPSASDSSALARNDPTLLTKTDPAPLVNRYGLPAGKSYFCPQARGDISFLRNTGRGGGIAWGSPRCYSSRRPLHAGTAGRVLLSSTCYICHSSQRPVVFRLERLPRGTLPGQLSQGESGGTPTLRCRI